MSDELQKCIKCKCQKWNWTKLKDGYICNECRAKEWLDYMTSEESPWAEEAYIALKYISELDEEIYNLNQHNQAMEVEIFELREELLKEDK